MTRIGRCLAMAATVTLLTTAPAQAATTGTTAVGPAVAGQHVDVTASVTSATPIAPYEFSVENKCWFSGRYSGHFDSYERFDIAGPWYSVGGVPTTTTQVNLNDVPPGAVCRVALYRATTAVKGSITSYAVTA